MEQEKTEQWWRHPNEMERDHISHLMVENQFLVKKKFNILFEQLSQIKLGSLTLILMLLTTCGWKSREHNEQLTNNLATLKIKSFLKNSYWITLSILFLLHIECGGWNANRYRGTFPLQSEKKNLIWMYLQGKCACGSCFHTDGCQQASKNPNCDFLIKHHGVSHSTKAI